MSPQSETVRSCRSGVSENIFPQDAPFKNTRRLAKFQDDRLPPLESLEYEVAVLRELLIRPTKPVQYSKHYTLNGHRNRSMERVARAALREGKAPEECVAILWGLASLVSRDDYYFCDLYARDIVSRELSSPHRRVLGYFGPKAVRVVVEFR